MPVAGSHVGVPPFAHQLRCCRREGLRMPEVPNQDTAFATLQRQIQEHHKCASSPALRNYSKTESSLQQRSNRTLRELPVTHRIEGGWAYTTRLV